MEIQQDTKIWKYMDLGKFLSLLTTQSLYFACPTQFTDPYEGWLPKSHVAAQSTMIRNVLDQYLAQRSQFISRGVPPRLFDDQIKDLARKLQSASKEVVTKFGVSCWHEAEHESDAMWRIYAASGRGIAIESTVGRFGSAIRHPDLLIDRVRYMDFERDPIEKGHRHYQLFIKRQSFSYEREVRATILLQEPGQGVSVTCDLEALISAVHISPLEERFVADAICAVCTGTPISLRKDVGQSKLYAPPDFGLDIDGF